MHSARVAALPAALLLLGGACSGGNDDAARVSIVAPEDGATVQSNFQVRVEAAGLTVAAAGDASPSARHLHVIVDAPCLARGARIPQNESHRRLVGDPGSTELTLTPGEHTLCAQAGDGAGAALDLTDEITITVSGSAATTGQSAEAAERWQGEYRGSVTWDCGPAGSRTGTLEGTVLVEVDDGAATLSGENTVTGSCAGPTTGTLTTPIAVSGERTSAGFRFPAQLWGLSQELVLEVDGGRATGRVTGAAPGPATVRLEFDLRCTRGC